MCTSLHFIRKMETTLGHGAYSSKTPLRQKTCISTLSTTILKQQALGAPHTSKLRPFSSHPKDGKSSISNIQYFYMKTAGSSPNINFGYPVPGPQYPTAQNVMNDKFFVSNEEWSRIQKEAKFDYVVIGTSFCALGFAKKVLANHPEKRILMLERGPFFLPDHFQNLPTPYQQTLGGLSETFPWTISEKMWHGRYIKCLRGSIPFFGGRSLMWSAWCPRPTEDEMEGWPKETIAAANRQFDKAEKLLNVIPVSQFDNSHTLIVKNRPIFGVLQSRLTSLLKNGLNKIPTATRIMSAPLAIDAHLEKYVDVIKFSTPSTLLKLIEQQRISASSERSSEIKVATECVVQRILQQNGLATALETSRGIVPIGDAKLILAMGPLPATTLVLNSFPQVKKAGASFTAHFISSIIARVPRRDYDFAKKLGELEMAAIYVAGCDRDKGQYHIQLTALADRDPEKNAANAARHMPDIVATATLEQLKESKHHIVFVCAVLGEIKKENQHNWFRRNEHTDITTNATLQALESKSDSLTWDTMEDATFDALEKVLSPFGAAHVEYWHPDIGGQSGTWQKEVRPQRNQIRAPGLVHEGSTMPIGEDENAVVDLDYRLKRTKNVYVTGNSISPRSGSWNPTLTMVALSQDLADKLSPSDSDNRGSTRKKTEV